ncbi:FAD-binding protein, partial [Lactobacillus delbrueckii]
MKLYDLKAQGLNLQENIPLSRYTFTQTGGPAEYLAFPKTLAELKELLAAAKEDQLPITVIGNASNLIIRDKGIKGLVIILKEMKEIKVEDDKVHAQAGARIIDTSFAAGEAGLSGLEFAAGIPGSV